MKKYHLKSWPSVRSGAREIDTVFVPEVRLLVAPPNSPEASDRFRFDSPRSERNPVAGTGEHIWQANPCEIDFAGLFLGFRCKPAEQEFLGKAANHAFRGANGKVPEHQADPTIRLRIIGIRNGSRCQVAAQA